MPRQQQPEAGPPPLPTDGLTGDQLEAFVDELLERLTRVSGDGPRLVSASRIGVSGQDQEGIDHYGTYDDGSTATWQDRARISMGPASVRKAIAETEVEADRHFLVYSRKASADARKEVRLHPGWDIWDQRDLTHKVLSLPVHEARAIVDRHFGRTVRRQVLPAADADAFVGVLEHFAPLLGEGRVFHHRTALAGRRQELEQLTQALSSGAPNVVTVSGPGGSGKSRLMLEVLRTAMNSQPTRPFVVRSGQLPLIEGALNELGGAPAVVLIEDAQRDLEGLVAILKFVRYTPGAQAVVTCRPNAAGAVRQAVVTSGFDPGEIGTWVLGPLDRSQAQELVDGLLSENGVGVHEAFRRVLVDEARDCPLVPVIAISMIAEGTLKSAALTLDAALREQVLDRFADVMREGIDRLAVEESEQLLALIAALAPVDLGDEELLDRMGSFLAKDRGRVLQQVQILIDHGVLQQDGRTVRIVPDVLADACLERAAIQVDTDTGYVDRVWAAFKGSAATLARNLAELDWRIRSAETEADLLATVWQDVSGEMLAGDASARLSGLSDLQELAGPQPARTCALIEELLAHPATEVQEWPGLTVTDETVRERLAPLLGICARTGDQPVRQRALDLLWALARSDARRPNQFPDHPRRVLQDLAEFGQPWAEEMQDALLERVARWLEEPAATDGLVTPLKLLSPLVAKGGASENWEPENNQLVFTPFLLAPGPVSGVRAAVRDIAGEQGRGPAVRRAIDAVEVLHSAIRAPIGMFGQEIPEGVVAQWHDDDLATLGVLQAIALATDEPLVRLAVRDAAAWHARYGPDPALMNSCRELIGLIDEHEGDLLTAALLGGMRDLAPRGAPFLQADVPAPDDNDWEALNGQQADEVRTAVSQLLDLVGPDRAVSVLGERCSVIADAGKEAMGVHDVVREVCRQSPPSAASIISAIVEQESSALDRTIHLPLDALRQQDEQDFVERLTELVQERADVAAAAIWGFRAHGWIDGVPSSATVLQAALKHDDDRVRQQAVFCCGQLIRQAPAAVAKILEGEAPARSHAILRALLDAGGDDFDAWVESLDPDAKTAVLRLLMATRAWDEWELSQILAAFARHDAEAAVREVVVAVARDGLPRGETAIEGLSAILAAAPPALAAILSECVTTSDQQRDRLTDLIPSLVGSPVTDAAAAVLTTMVDGAGDTDLMRLAALLERCVALVPLRPHLVERILTRASMYDDQVQERVRRSLKRSAMPSVDVGFGDDLPPKLARLRSSAEAHSVDDSLSEQSRAFYAELLTAGVFQDLESPDAS